MTSTTADLPMTTSTSPAYGTPITVDEKRPAGDRVRPERDSVQLSADAIPWCEPNVRPGHEKEDLAAVINGDHKLDSGRCWNIGCILGGIGCCAIACCGSWKLVQQQQYAFVRDNGRLHILFEGWHLYLDPFIHWVDPIYNASDQRIEVGPIHIIRVDQGKIATAFNNGMVELLLPGIHVRNSPAFIMGDTYDLFSPYISIGSVHIFTVSSGTVRVCQDKGVVRICPQGRYAVNSAVFTVLAEISTRQQSVRFSKHPVVLNGGVNMTVEGLLTYHVKVPEKLLHHMGPEMLLRSIEDVTKAELTKLFSQLNLEAISSGHLAGGDGRSSVLGKVAHSTDRDAKEGQTPQVRSWICQMVLEEVGKMAEQWGVELLNFQIEEMNLTDRGFAADYERQSLQMAQAEAKRRAQEAENQRVINVARATAETTKIQAEATKAATIYQAESKAEAVKIEAKGNSESAQILATGKAEATKIEAKGEAEATVTKAEAMRKARQLEGEGRNQAAEAMRSDFAKEYAFGEQRVATTAALLKSLTHLTVVPDSVLASQFFRGAGAPGSMLAPPRREAMDEKR